MRLGFVTLFPEVMQPYLGASILGRAQTAGLLQVEFANPRDFAEDRHRTVDHPPYGGGPGMVLMAPIVAAAVNALASTEPSYVVLMDAAGTPFKQADAERLAAKESLILICGHYEGVDDRVRTQVADEAISIGDFVLTGGELPALVLADAVTRLLPSVLGDAESHADDSFSNSGLLGFPLFTKPREFRGESVPEVLLSGNHEAINRWRRREQLIRTREHRPDLFARADLSVEDLKSL